LKSNSSSLLVSSRKEVMRSSAACSRHIKKLSRAATGKMESVFAWIPLYLRGSPRACQLGEFRNPEPMCVTRRRKFSRADAA
jgi:hypothetical protein